MSLTWMTRVFEAPEPRQSERLLLLALADNANDAGVCWPSVPTLQRKCGLDTKRGARMLLRRVAVRPGTSHLYRLVYLPPQESAEKEAPEDGGPEDGPEGGPEGGGAFEYDLTPDVQFPPEAPFPPEPQFRGTPESPFPSPLNPGSPKPSENPQLNPQHQHARAGEIAAGVTAGVPDPPPRGGVVALDGEGEGGDQRSPGDPSAAELQAGQDAKQQREEREREAVTALCRRDVKVRVARALVAEFGPGRVARSCAWYDHEQRAGKARGPGLLVSAVRDNLAASAEAQQLLTYAQMLGALDKLGAGARQSDHFETVRQPDGEVLFRPIPRRGHRLRQVK